MQWRKIVFTGGLAFVLIAMSLHDAARWTATPALADERPVTTAPTISGPTTRLESRSANPATTRATTLPAIVGRAGGFDERPAPREMLSDDQYKQLAVELRAEYIKPPDQWPAARVDPSLHVKELGLLPKPEHPTANPYSKEKALLGEELFFDPRLSSSGQIACANCHDPELGWADGRAVAFGHDRSPTKRNAPTVMGAAYGTLFFDDGRAESLEKQALEPITSPGEMHGDAKAIAERLNADADYLAQFKQVFTIDTIHIDHVAMAIACFERTIIAGRSRFDQFLRGKVEALDDGAVRGLHLFRTEAGCLQCHNGPNLSDGQFHNLGLSYYGRKFEDLGRYVVTKKPEDVGAFKTPTLRNITRTAPYMHNGLFELQGVLNLYNAGMPTLTPRGEQVNDPLFPKKSSLLHSLGLNAHDLDDLKSFLASLEEPRQRVRPDELRNRAATTRSSTPQHEAP